jgi:hypothetical protein
METIRFRPEPQKGKHAKVIAQDFMRLDALEIVSPLYRELVELTRRPASMPAGIKGGVLRRQLPAENGVGDLLADHDRWRIGIARRQRRHQ